MPRHEKLGSPNAYFDNMKLSRRGVIFIFFPEIEIVPDGQINPFIRIKGVWCLGKLSVWAAQNTGKQNDKIRMARMVCSFLVRF